MPIIGSVIVTFVIRLVRERLAAGEVVGQLELVQTGEQTTVRSAEELVGALRAGDTVDRGQPELEEEQR